MSELRDANRKFALNPGGADESNLVSLTESESSCFPFMLAAANDRKFLSHPKA